MVSQEVMVILDFNALKFIHMFKDYVWPFFTIVKIEKYAIIMIINCKYLLRIL